MSAYIVNDNHLSAIVRWACKNNVSVYSSNPVHHVTMGNMGPFRIPGSEDELVNILHAENIKSVNYRYGETDEPAKIVYDAFATRLSAVECIKACHCLDYQSCEHDGWDASFAKAAVDAILEAATRELPGYDAAAWEVKEKVAA